MDYIDGAPDIRRHLHMLIEMAVRLGWLALLRVACHGMGCDGHDLYLSSGPPLTLHCVLQEYPVLHLQPQSNGLSICISPQAILSVHKP